MCEPKGLLQLCVINPLIVKCKKRFIYSIDFKSSKIFFWLLSERIWIDGFIDEKLKDGKIWGKPIYGIDQLQDNDDTLLITSEEIRINKRKIHICSELKVFNPEIKNLEVYIYGAGKVGQSLLEILNKSKFKVEGFIDSDNNKIGKKILDKEIYDNNVLGCLPFDAVVIEAGKYYKEIDAVICGIEPKLKRFYYQAETDCKPMLVDGIVIDYQKKIYMRPYTLNQLTENVPFGKKIILWGEDGELAYEYYEILKLIGFTDLCIVSNVKTADKSDMEIIQQIEDVLYETNYLVLIYGKITEWHTERIQRLGLIHGKNYVLFDYPVPMCKMGGRKQILDLNLGYSYIMNSEYPGLFILGKNKNEDYKIAILGGSTSDSDLYWYKSWPEVFYEQYCGCGKNITIINGAIAGYNSAQELIKLMRDMINLKPDMLIIFDGINDITAKANSGRSLFGFSYLKTILKYLTERSKIDQYVLPVTMNDNIEIWAGVESDTCDVIEKWQDNIKYMEAISKINGVKFHAFLQPMLFGKKKASTLHEASLMKVNEIALGSWFKEQCCIFRNIGSVMNDKYEYFHDLSQIFDYCDVYMDECHVYERGNIIIAQEIYKYIASDIPES